MRNHRLNLTPYWQICLGKTRKPNPLLPSFGTLATGLVWKKWSWSTNRKLRCRSRGAGRGAEPRAGQRHLRGRGPLRVHRLQLHRRQEALRKKPSRPGLNFSYRTGLNMVLETQLTCWTVTYQNGRKYVAEYISHGPVPTVYNSCAELLPLIIAAQRLAQVPSFTIAAKNLLSLHIL